MPEGEIGRVAARLLAATEALYGAVLSDASLEELEAAWRERASAFEALRAGIEAGATLDTAARTCVDRVRDLDAELLSQGDARSLAIRDERRSLDRRRAVIQAHATRERPEPRAMSVKA